MSSETYDGFEQEPLGFESTNGSPSRGGSPSHPSHGASRGNSRGGSRQGSPSYYESPMRTNRSGGSPFRPSSRGTPTPRGTSARNQRGGTGGITSEAYFSATKKLSEAAWRYDREKDPRFIHNLENRELDKEDFRRILKIGLDCRLTREELDALIPLYDNNGKVDGFEFILTFYHLRFEHRGLQLTSRVEAEKRLKDALVNDVEQKNSYHEQKNLLHLIDEVTDVESSSAMKKLVEAAGLYDRTQSGMLPLDAFDAESMRPEEFRLQLKTTFNLPVTIGELTAIIKLINKDKPEEENVNCASFLVFFLRLGFQERSRKLKEIWQDQKNSKDIMTAREMHIIEEFSEKNALKRISEVDLKYTTVDKENAMNKLKEAAKLYVMQSKGTVSLRSFEVSHMSPHQFREQMKRVFKLLMSSAEIGALLAEYPDTAHEGSISCPDFVKSMISMGITQHEKDMRARIDAHRREEENTKIEEKKKQEELAYKFSLQYSRTFSEEDMENALRMLTEAARKYDKNMPGQPMLNGFENILYMEPHVFKDQMQRAFRLKISSQEIGALLLYFNADEKGNVFMATFLAKFFKIGLEERQERRSKWLSHRSALLESQKIEESNKQKAADEKQILKLRGYSEADFQSAMAKLTEGALRYDRSGALNAGLGGFQNVTMPPHVFKDQLRRVFNIFTTLEEVSAMMAHFDKKGTGVISCQYFMAQFFKMGIDERSRLRATFLQARHEKEEDEILIIRQNEEKEKQDSILACNFEFTETDFDSALKKFVFKCHAFETRELGPLGWSSFTADSLAFYDFKNCLKIRFDLKMTSLEIGALVMFCYPTGKGKQLMSCRIFINQFLQNKLVTEAYKGRPDENNRVRKYIATLKEAYRVRSKRLKEPGEIDATNPKPWRMNAIRVEAVSRPLSSIPKGAPPTTATEKLKLRLTVGRKSTRMDLSTKRGWVKDSNGMEGGVRVVNALKSKGRKSLQPRGSKVIDDISKLERIAAMARVMKNEMSADTLDGSIDEAENDIDTQLQKSVSSLKNSADRLNKRSHSVTGSKFGQNQNQFNGNLLLIQTVSNNNNKNGINILNKNKRSLSVSGGKFDGKERQENFLNSRSSSPSFRRNFSPSRNESDSSGDDNDDKKKEKNEKREGKEKKDGKEGKGKKDSYGKIKGRDEVSEKERREREKKERKESESRDRGSMDEVMMNLMVEVIDCTDEMLGNANDFHTNKNNNNSTRNTNNNNDEQINDEMMRTMMMIPTLTEYEVHFLTDATSDYRVASESHISKMIDTCVQSYLISHNIKMAVERVVAEIVNAGLKSVSPVNDDVTVVTYATSAFTEDTDREPNQESTLESTMESGLELGSSSKAVTGFDPIPAPTPPSILESNLESGLKSGPESGRGSEDVLTPSNCESYSSYTPYSAYSTADPSPSQTQPGSPGPPSGPHSGNSHGISQLAAFMDDLSASSSSDFKNKNNKKNDNTGKSDNTVTSELTQTLNTEMGSLDFSKSAHIGDINERIPIGGAIMTPAGPSGPDLGPYKKGKYGYNIPSSVNGYNFVKDEGENCYSVVKVIGNKSNKKDKDKDKEREKDVESKATIVMTFEMKMKKKAGLERKEVFRQALEARSQIGMLAEFTLTSIPDHVLKMHKLTELWLCNNLIHDIPPEIADLKNLTVLSLKGNNLSSLPNEICLLVKLQRLYLSGNKLKKLPDLFKLFKKLKDLDIRQNEFEVFPEVICTLQALELLDVSDNYFESLPLKLKNLRSLSTLSMCDTIVCGDATVLTAMNWVNVSGFKNYIPSQLSTESGSMVPGGPDWHKSRDSHQKDSHPTPTPFFLFSSQSRLKGKSERMFPKGVDNDDEDDLDEFIRNRASSRITAKLRRRKGKRSTTMTSPSKPEI